MVGADANNRRICERVRRLYFSYIQTVQPAVPLHLPRFIRRKQHPHSPPFSFIALVFRNGRRAVANRGEQQCETPALRTFYHASRRSATLLRRE
jgi:hypothetical protein